MNKIDLMAKINDIELLITIYSDRDNVRTVQLEKQLYDLNMELLDKMTNEKAA